MIIPGVEWWPQKTAAQQIARVGRICYKSKGKQPDENLPEDKKEDFLEEQAVNLANRFWKSGHRSMYRHGTLTIAFNPPTIKNREVNHTVHLGLLTRCAGSLERTGRSIHPDIDTRYQATGKLHIVVLEEDNLTEELWTLADFKDLLDKSLSGAVSGVSLTREEEEHWMLGVVNNLAEAIQVGEEQVGALVSSKTTAEANHQRVGVDALQQ